MSPIGAIIWAKIKIAQHQVASVRHESRLKIAVLTISATLLWLGAYALLRAGFDFLLRLGGRGGEFNFGDILMARMLYLFALAIFLLLIFSNVLVAFSTLYRAKEVMYLLHTPLSFEQFFYVRFLESVMFSSWSLAFLGAPLILAYGRSSGVPWSFYASAAVYFVPFVVIPAAIGAIIAMVFVRIFPRLRLPTLLLGAALILVWFFRYIYLTFRQTRLDEQDFLPFLLEFTARSQSPFLPSTWFVRGVLATTTGDRYDALFQLLLLTSYAALAVWVGGQVAQRIFHDGFSALLGMDKQRIKRPQRSVFWYLDRALFFIRPWYRSLVLKDLRLFWRDPTQWSQFAIFFGIMGVYIANLPNVARVFQEQEMWRNWTACLNTGSLTLILATLTSRFIFPLISLEGRRFWILGLAPLTLRQLLWQKFWLSVGTASLYTLVLALLSATLLRLEPVYYGLTVLTVAAANFGLSGLAVGLGALYPNFNEDNPARIVSGMGGTLNLLLSVGYITVIVAAQILVLQWRSVGVFVEPYYFWVALGGACLVIVGLTALCVFLPMHLGLRNLQRAEF